MSRIGKLPIKIPSNVIINYNVSTLKIKGQFGELTINLPDSLKIEHQEDKIIIIPVIRTRTSSALYGLYRSLINNMIIGVSKKFTVVLILQGVGYRATVKENQLILNLGYSHLINLEIPKNISVTVIKNTTLNLVSCNKEELGLFAAKIRFYRLPEPYKGKGIRYETEIIKRKAGKSGKK